MDTQNSKEKSNMRYILYVTGIILTIYCLITPYSNAANNTNDFNKLSPSEQAKMAKIERQIITAATQSFVSSLEMKENVDFILTPALLVQESISSNQVTTYPSE